MIGWIRRWKKRIRTLIRRDAVERELDEELAFHLEMETEKNLRAGMNPEEARRQAAIKFGGVDRYKEKVREARVLGWVPGMSLDFKLGFRMLLKYPGLTVVAGLALAFAIAVGAVTIEFFSDYIHPSLPLDEGDRIVSIWNQDLSNGGADPRVLQDFVLWRQEARSVEEIGAFRTFRRNLVTPGGLAKPVFGAEMTSTAFGLARVPPLLGRPLRASDDEAGAPPVVVIGYDLWQSFFGGDAGVAGKVVRLGPDRVTVVGVMPDQFALKEKNDVLFVATTDMQAMTSGLTSLKESGGSFTELDHIGGLAPEEALTAARFVGDMAYLVTWEMMWGDPLFTIDISDPKNMILGGELAVTGWSDYLHPLGDEHLLAVGMDEDSSGWHLAVSLFDVSDFENPQLADRILLDAWSSEAQTEHHAFNYFSVTESLTLPSYASEGNTVLEVLQANAEGLEAIGRVTWPDALNDDENYQCTNIRRSVVMDDMVWAISNSGMVAAELDAPENILATIEYEDIDPCVDIYGGWGWNQWNEW